MKVLKYVFIVCITLVISTCSCLAYVNYSEKTEDKIIDKTKIVTVIVDEGDTLWNIAQPFYDGKVDYRNFIYSIQKINNIEKYTIYPGQEIIIPL